MAKDRSPNYPAYDLRSAVDFARTIRSKEGRSSADPGTIADDLGYKALSGSARQKIAALKQFELLEDVPGKKLRLSQRAIDLTTLLPTDEQYAKLVHETAFTPALFGEFRDKYPEASDRNLFVTLTTGGRGFSPEGARRAIKAYRDTVAFANAGAPGYTEVENEADVEEPGENLDRGESGTPPKHDPPRTETNNVTYSCLLQDAERLEVTFVGTSGKKPTRRDVEGAIDYLELLKKRTPEPEPPDPRSVREQRRMDAAEVIE